MLRLEKREIIKPTDFKGVIITLNENYGFRLVIGEEFTPGTHCSGAEPFGSSNACCDRTCGGPNGSITHGVIKIRPCVFYGIVE